MSKKTKVIEVPDSKTFADHLALTFFQNEGIQIETQENEGPMDVIFSIPELNQEFTLWLCDSLRNKIFPETSSPPDSLLN